MTQNSSVPAFRQERIAAARAAAAAAAASDQQPGGNIEQPPAETPPHVDPNKDANDAAAWKGRLTKTQEELRAEREAKQQLTVEALQAAERARQAEERARQAEARLAETNDKLNVYEQKERENFLSDDEKRQLADTFGEDATDLLTRLLGKVRPTTPSVNFDEVVDKKLQEAQAKTLEREWASAVKDKIPEAHVLRADEDFIQFATNKTDWLGNSALSVMDEIGATRDVSRIDIIQKLIAEYKALKNPGQQDNVNNPTVPPRNTQTTPSRPNQSGKKRVSPADFSSMVQYYKSRGDTKGLRQYLAEHEESK